MDDGLRMDFDTFTAHLEIWMDIWHGPKAG
jgi:hypothetical protein